MQPKIIVSSDQKERDEEIWSILSNFQIAQDNPDLLVLDDEKIGISQIKQLIRHLSTKPFGKTAKSAIILSGNNISSDAQNALLKILEEPPADSIIVIGADSETKFLSTVLSRCLVINLESAKNKPASDFNLNALIYSSLEERFEIIEKETNKELLLNNITESYRNSVINGERPAGFLEELLQAHIWKESNVNIRTILEYLMLKLEK